MSPPTTVKKGIFMVTCIHWFHIGFMIKLNSFIFIQNNMIKNHPAQKRQWGGF